MDVRMRVTPAVVMVVLAALVCLATQGVAANAGHSAPPGVATPGRPPPPSTHHSATRHGPDRHPPPSTHHSATRHGREYEQLLTFISDLEPAEVSHGQGHRDGRAMSGGAGGAGGSAGGSAGGDAVAGGAGGPTSNADLRWMLVTHSRQKRNVVQLGEMMKCATGCSPVAYKGYGCYCGFLGSGPIVDGIDHCCYEHDWCYWRANYCFTDPFGLSFYLSAYKWSCKGGEPRCEGGGSACSRQLCECDRRFARCLRRYPCPRSRPVCESSPLRHWQNLFLGMRKTPYHITLDSTYDGYEEFGGSESRGFSR